jgi:hypothetical protein
LFTLHRTAIGTLALITKDNIQAARVGDAASVSGSGSLGQKRRTPESIVTRAPAPPPKHGRGVWGRQELRAGSLGGWRWILAVGTAGEAAAIGGPGIAETDFGDTLRRSHKYMCKYKYLYIFTTSAVSNRVYNLCFVS